MKSVSGVEKVAHVFGHCFCFTEKVLEEAAVVISPGAAYGPSGEGFVRMSLTTPDDRLMEAAERISRLVDG